MTIAIYAGTFDPFTLGHEDVLDRARQIFDEVIVAVAADTGRNTFFSFEERVDLARRSLAGIEGVRVVGFEGLLSEFVKATGASVLIRGVRNGSDFDYDDNIMSGIYEYVGQKATNSLTINGGGIDAELRFTY